MPGWFHRKTAEQKMGSVGGLLKARTLANMDSRGVGPGGKMVNGKRMYEKQHFLLWLRNYLEESESRSVERKKAQRGQ